MPVKIKICGITSVNDALAAFNAGADAIGLMFYEQSPRHVTVKTATEIVRALPPFIAKVGVFVDAPAEDVKRIVSTVGVDTLQFHGEESPEYCLQFAPLKVVKAFRVKDAKSLRELSPYNTDAWLLDSFVKDKLGGTGATFDWSLASDAKDAGTPVILAGGLMPENIAEAVHEVWPFGVDVSSGVESAPGKKDERMIRDFVAAVRGIEGDKF